MSSLLLLFLLSEDLGEVGFPFTEGKASHFHCGDEVLFQGLRFVNLVGISVAVVDVEAVAIISTTLSGNVPSSLMMWAWWM